MINELDIKNRVIDSLAAETVQLEDKISGLAKQLAYASQIIEQVEEHRAYMWTKICEWAAWLEHEDAVICSGSTFHAEMVAIVQGVQEAERVDEVDGGDGVDGVDDDEDLVDEVDQRPAKAVTSEPEVKL